MTRHTATARRIAGRTFAAFLLAAGMTAGAARADDKPDPVVAKIGTDVIRLSELNAAAQSLPPQARQMPPEQLLPRLLDQMVDTRLLALEAHRIGLDKDPAVQKVLRDVQERALVSTMLERQVGPQITDAALKERFDKDLAAK